MQLSKGAKTLIVKDQKRAQEEARAVAIAQADKKAVIQDATARGDRFVSFLDEAKSVEGLLERFATLLKEATSAGSVYIGELRNDAFEAMGAEFSGSLRDPSADYIRYVAASEPNSDMLKRRLNAGEGVTHELFAEDPQDEGEVEERFDKETGEPLPPLPKPEKPLKSVFVANTLTGPLSDQLKFFEVPQTGCYLTVRVEYDSCLHDNAMDETEQALRDIEEEAAREAEEKAAAEQERKAREAAEEEERRRAREEEYEQLSEEDRAERERVDEAERVAKEAAEIARQMQSEEEKEARAAQDAEDKVKSDEKKLVDRLTKHKVRYAICLDTLGQNRRFTDGEVAAVQQLCKRLRETLLRLDVETFKAERAARKMIAEVAAVADRKSEDDRRDEVAALFDQYSRAGDASVKPEDAAFQHRQGVVAALRQQVLELRSYNVLRGSPAVLQAALYLLGYPQDKVADSDDRADWRKLRQCIDDEFARKIEGYRPREAFAKAQQEKGEAKSAAAAAAGAGAAQRAVNTAAIEALVSRVDYEELLSRNYVLAEVLGFVLDAVAVLKVAVQEDKRAKAREKRRLAEEKAAAEEEARLRAEADADAAAARAEKGIIDEVDEGDE